VGRILGRENRVQKLQDSLLFFFSIYLFEYSWHTMLHEFQVYNRVTISIVYAMLPTSVVTISHQKILLQYHLTLFPVLCLLFQWEAACSDEGAEQDQCG